MKRFLLLTANVGSLFEEEARLQGPWLKVIANRILKEKAELVLIHMQETGGKHFAQCSWQVPKLVNDLADTINDEYPICRALLDLDFENPMYTALGTIIFVRSTSANLVQQYNFDTNTYSFLKRGFEVITKDLDNYSNVIKQKFPKNFWPTIKWGRKGFMHTRFRTGSHYFDFINVHLFHDESNLALIHENPQLYSSNRKRALDYVLEQVKEKENGHPAMLFIFGDLNFRLNCPSFLNKLTARTESHPINDDIPHGSVADGLSATNSEAHLSAQNPEHLRRTVSAIEFRRDLSEADEDSAVSNNCVLRIEKKRFDYFNHKKLLHDWVKYLEDDREAKHFPDLLEMPITFPPTYPWSEDPSESDILMKTRAPAWCDRVLMNERAWIQANKGDNIYESIGRDTCMGDHKPVLLAFSLPE